MRPLTIFVLSTALVLSLASCRGSEGSDPASETIAPAAPQPAATGTDEMTQTIDIEDSRTEAEGAGLTTDTATTATTETTATTGTR